MKMKKLWASLLCLMMVLVMALTMTACEKDKKDDEDEDEKESTSQTDSIVGEWKANINFGELMDAAGQAEMAEVFEMLGIDSMPFYAEFKANGEALLWADKDEILDAMSDGMKDYLTEMLEAQGASLDDYLAETGMTWDELMEEAMAEFDPSDLETKIYYELDGEDLLTGDSKDELKKEGTFDGDEIVLEINGYTVTFERA